jgi:hypothetical protein
MTKLSVNRVGALLMRGTDTVSGERVIVKDMPLPDKTEAEQEQEFKMFVSNFRLIQKYADFIIGTPEYFHILMKNLLVGSMLTGGNYVPLGVWLLLWKEGLMISCCPQCAAEAYIFKAGGSLLSGGNSYTALCPACTKTFHGSVPSFSSLFFPVKEKKEGYPNKVKILIRETQCFSWGKGLEGNSTPNKILEDGIHPVDLKTLIAKLEQKEWEEAT